MTQSTVLIMAAGTGGHIYPALTVAKLLQANNIDVQWLGTPSGMENDVLADTGIRLHRLPVNGLRGKGLLALVAAPFMLLRSFWQAMSLIRQLRPCCVLGMGGYVAGPGGLAAWISGRPLVIHEQNAVAGTTNRLLAPIATRVLESFPDTFAKSRRAVCTGNPVRAEIVAMRSGDRSYDGERPLQLLVLGGSLGAAAVNALVVDALAGLKDDLVVHVLHQSGKLKLDDTRSAYAAAGLSGDGQYRIVPFIDDMPAAYQWADLVVCRAGAGTLAELAVAGLPSILVPYPYAIDDHQSVNAGHLVSAGAAQMYSQQALTAEKLSSVLLRLAAAPDQLRAMALAARGLAMPDAGSRLMSVCMEVCNDR